VLVNLLPYVGFEGSHRTVVFSHYRHIGQVAIGGGREFTAYKDLKECRV
jgi:hypothetical protein